MYFPESFFGFFWAGAFFEAFFGWASVILGLLIVLFFLKVSLPFWAPWELPWGAGGEEEPTAITAAGAGAGTVWELSLTCPISHQNTKSKMFIFILCTNYTTILNPLTAYHDPMPSFTHKPPSMETTRDMARHESQNTPASKAPVKSCNSWTLISISS